MNWCLFFSTETLTGYPQSWRECVQHRSIPSPTQTGLSLAPSPAWKARLQPASDPCCASACTHTRSASLPLTDSESHPWGKPWPCKYTLGYVTWSPPGSCVSLAEGSLVTPECTVYTAPPGSAPASASLKNKWPTRTVNSHLCQVLSSLKALVWLKKIEKHDPIGRQAI